jgi:hypothetical protein
MAMEFWEGKGTPGRIKKRYTGVMDSQLIAMFNRVVLNAWTAVNHRIVRTLREYYGDMTQAHLAIAVYFFILFYLHSINYVSSGNSATGRYSFEEATSMALTRLRASLIPNNRAEMFRHI